MWLGLMQTLWDSGEPSGYLDSIVTDPLPDNPQSGFWHRPALVMLKYIHWVLYHDAWRRWWIDLSTDQNRLGIEELDDGVMGSGLVEWDYGMPEPVENTPNSI